MMQTLRDYMKHIIIITAIAFIATIVFSWGMGGFKGKRSAVERGIIGIVNGKKIMYQQFNASVNQAIEYQRQRSNNAELTDLQIRSIRDRVWEDMVREILFHEQIQKYGLSATIKEISINLQNNPPSFVKNLEQLQTDGAFDITKYRQAISDPANKETFTKLIVNHFAINLPYDKLIQYIISLARVSDAEAEMTFRRENEKVKVNYIFFDADSIPKENIKIEDSEIKKYYEEHKEDYRVPEKRKIQYVLFENKPSKDDSTQTLYDIQDILKEIKSGGSFEELAKKYSEDEGTASEGGDLGYFSRGMMVKPFEDAAFSAKIGEVVGPIKTRFGLHLIKVVDRKKEDGEVKVHAKHILLKYKPSPATYEYITQSSDYFYKEVRSKGPEFFARLAKQEGFDLKETPLFKQGEFIRGIGIEPTINYYTFSQKLYWVSRPIYSGEKIFVFQIIDIEKSHIKPLEDVKTEIVSLLEKKEQKKIAGKMCEEFWKSIDYKTSFEELARKHSLTLQSTDFFTLGAYIPGVGREPDFAGTAFKLNIGDISRPIEGENGYYIIKVTDKIEFDKNQFESQKNEIKRRLFAQKQQLVYQEWYNSLKRKAKIKDFRSQYF